MGDHLGELGRGHAMREADEVLARHIHVDQHAGQLCGVHRHGFGCHCHVDVVARDETVDHVEVMFEDAVERDDLAAAHFQSGLWVGGAGEGAEAVGCVFRREAIEPQRPLIPVGIALPAVGRRHGVTASTTVAGALGFPFTFSRIHWKTT